MVAGRRVPPAGAARTAAPLPYALLPAASLTPAIRRAVFGATSVGIGALRWRSTGRRDIETALVKALAKMKENAISYMAQYFAFVISTLSKLSAYNLIINDGGNRAENACYMCVKAHGCNSGIERLLATRQHAQKMATPSSSVTMSVMAHAGI